MTTNLHSIRSKLNHNIQASRDATEDAQQQLLVLDALSHAVKSGLSRTVLDEFIAYVEGADTSAAAPAPTPAPATTNGSKSSRPRAPATTAASTPAQNQPKSKQRGEHSIKEGIKSVLGKRSMSAKEIYDALVEKSFPINSKDPLNYVRFTLSTSFAKDAEKGRGFYRVPTDVKAPKGQNRTTTSVILEGQGHGGQENRANLS